jgi:hypothetical protein
MDKNKFLNKKRHRFNNTNGHSGKTEKPTNRVANHKPINGGGIKKRAPFNKGPKTETSNRISKIEGLFQKAKSLYEEKVR